jgi:hypothetical protein
MGADVIGKHFTQIYNGALRDRRLSAKARGILAWSLTHEDGFGFSVAAMVAAGLGGANAVSTGLAELEKLGYLRRDRERNEKGHLGQAVYLLTDMPQGLPALNELLAKGLEISEPAKETPRSEPECDFPAQVEGGGFVPILGFPDQADPGQADRAHKKTPFVEDHAFTPLKAGKNTPPPPSSVGAGSHDATPEAPLEDEEEMKGRDDKHTPSAPPEEWSAGRAAFEEATDGVQEALLGALGFLGTLPGLNGLQNGSYGFLAESVVEAFDAGWTEDTLRTWLKPLIDPTKAKNPGAVPTWYARHLGGLPDAPKPVVPLCNHPGHQQAPKKDPVNGGCFFCNTQAATGPRTKTAMKGNDVVETTDALTARALCRQAVATRFKMTEPPETETSALRAWREADENRRKANDLLRTEV